MTESELAERLDKDELARLAFALLYELNITHDDAYPGSFPNWTMEDALELAGIGDQGGNNGTHT